MRPNAIAPGTVNTPMIDQVARDIAARTGLPFAEQRAALVGDTPTGRIQEPNEIAAAVRGIAPRRAPARPGVPQFAGLEPLTIRPDSNSQKCLDVQGPSDAAYTSGQGLPTAGARVQNEDGSWTVK